MNIKIMRIGGKGESHIVPEYVNDDAWYAHIELGRQVIDIKVVDGELELHCPTGRLIIIPDIANSIRVRPVQL